MNINHTIRLDDTIIFLLKQIILKENQIMSSIDDLNAAISDLTTSITNEVSALESARASNNDVAVEQAVSNLKALNTQLQNSVTPPAPATDTPPAQ